MGAGIFRKITALVLATAAWLPAAAAKPRLVILATGGTMAGAQPVNAIGRALGLNLFDPNR